MKDLTALGLYPITGTYHPLNELEIKQLEELKGYSLPIDYKQFIQEYGWSGFFPRVSVRPIEPPQPQVTDQGVLGFVSFYGSEIGRGGLLSINKSPFIDSMPLHMMPIAESDSSSQFLLSLDQKSNGAIFFWNFEEWPDPDDYLEEGLEVPKDWQYKNLSLVATSFSDFLERLVPVALPEGE